MDSLFTAFAPIITARAPGRLDVMGGISDYSGGLCLEWPLALATTCRAQARDDTRLVAVSKQAASENWQECVEVPLGELAALDYASGRARWSGGAAWARYVLGAFLVLHAERGWMPPHGVSLEVDSEVPHGAGVSSSAALEVACLWAINRLFDLGLSGHAVALLAQKVENYVALAPCGVMDQLSVALGESGRLLRLRCQPDIVEGRVIPPEGIEFWGIDSGAKHSVGGGAYGIARCGAFMGRKIALELAPTALRGRDGGYYLANIPASVWRALRERIPETLRGADFLAQYGSHDDPVTQVEPERVYNVRLNAEHPVYEADRVAKFAEFLPLAHENPAARQEFGRAAGELMVQSHFSYDHRCDLGSKETDLLVQLARDAGPEQGIYGAKITGGGSGGTVALLTDRHLNPGVETAIQDIANAYARQTGIAPRIFSGTSNGAAHND